MKPSAYTWLLFDADGTLFDYEQAEATALTGTFAQFAVPYSASVLDVYHLINAQLWQAFEQGQITPPELATRRFELLFETLARPTPPQFGSAYLEHLARQTFLIDGAEAVLKALQPRYQFAIVTNGLKAVQRPRLARSGIAHFFQALIISEEVGVAKPEAAYFDITFERLGQPSKSEVLMIGDSLSSDIRGAVAYGLDTCWYNPARLPLPSDIAVTREIRSLSELVTWLA